MIYTGEPNLHVIDYENGREVFCMNEKGTFETSDEKLIAWMEKYKPHIKSKLKKK